MKEKEFLPAVREKLGIEELNDMQRRMLDTTSEGGDVILLSPTGSGKTLAFLLPVLKLMKPSTGRIQAVIVVPTRELVVQITDTLKMLGTGFRVASLYGGHKVEDEVNTLKGGVDIVVATPGRLLDHSIRGNAILEPVRILVLDEFDKSLELGFEKEMGRLVDRMKNVSRKILTSATDMADIPEFVGLNTPRKISFLSDNDNLRRRLKVHKVMSSEKDKLDALYELLYKIMPEGNEKTIVFVNHRESAERIREGLRHRGLIPGIYHGALDQHDREKALAMFTNGTSPVLVSTDLGARGLDIDKVRNIVHYHQPLDEEAYTHRNGRTARVEASGDIYVLLGPDEPLKPYVISDDEFTLDGSCGRMPASGKETIYISAGKREKLSKGDIVGFLVKQAGIDASHIGAIMVRDHYALVGIDSKDAKAAVSTGAREKIKGQKRKVTIAAH